MIAPVRALVWVGMVVALLAAPGGAPWFGDRAALGQAQGQAPGGALGDASDPDF